MLVQDGGLEEGMNTSRILMMIKTAANFHNLDTFSIRNADKLYEDESSHHNWCNLKARERQH